ncbi:MAG: hypothetical protein CMB97_07785 [Flavobacteriaceae bacterium]|nr:hypothetical protein [Flavobacteriaceae bacterium]
MPHFLGEILVATKEELVPLWFSNSKSLSSKLSQFKDKPYGPKRALIGGNGRKLLVVFDTLPKKIQDALGDPRQPEHPLDKHYKIDPAATRFYTTYLFDDGEPLTMDAQDKHITSASILEAVKKLEIDRRTERKNKGGSLRDVNKTLWQDAMSFIKLQEKREGESFQHNLNKKYRYFMDQFKNFKKESFKGIIKNYKSNTNAKKVRKLEEKLLNDLFATQQDKPHATKVARQYEAFLNGYLEIVNNKTGEVYDPKDFNPVAQSTIALYLNKWENKIGTYAARSGDRQKLMSQFSPYHSFERPKFAGSILSIDDRQPPFEYEKGKRMWFYIGIDLASEAITCWVHGKTKEDLIINFYRELVRNYHAWGYSLPLELECESSLNSSFKNTFLRNGAMFQEVRIEANKARAKKIERYFGKLRYEVEKEHEGWIARPFARSESNQAGSTSKKIIPFPQLANDRIQDLVDWNNSAHSVDNSISRWDYFTANQNPDLKPTNYKAILPYMGKRTETSCNVGIIKLQRSEFLLGDAGKIATGEKLLNLMTKTEGRNIEVFWLDDHEGKVFKALVYINGQLRTNDLLKVFYGFL